MKKSILFLIISSVFVFSSCCKDREDRTTYLPKMAEILLNIYQEGETFEMLQNDTLLCTYKVGDSKRHEESSGLFCSKEWFQSARITMNSTIGANFTFVAFDETKYNLDLITYDFIIGLDTDTIILHENYGNCFYNSIGDCSIIISDTAGIVSVVGKRYHLRKK